MHESCSLAERRTEMEVIAKSMTESFRFPVEAEWGAGGFPLILFFLRKGIGSGTHAATSLSEAS